MAQTMRHGSPLHLHAHYETRVQGEQDRRKALVWLLGGVPAAFVLWQLWSVMVLGPGRLDRVRDPRYTSWAAVLVLSPAMGAVIAAALVSMRHAARACRAAVPDCEVVLALTTAGLLVSLAAVLTVSADFVQNPITPTTTWVMWAVSAVVALGCAGVAQVWAHAPLR